MQFQTTQAIIAHYEPLRKRGPAVLYSDSDNRIAVYHAPTRHWHWFAWKDDHYEQTGSTLQLYLPGKFVTRLNSR